MFARFLVREGTGESQILPFAVDSSSILSVENRAGTPSNHGLPKKASPGHRLSAGDIRLFLRAGECANCGVQEGGT